MAAWVWWLVAASVALMLAWGVGWVIRRGGRQAAPVRAPKPAAPVEAPRSVAAVVPAAAQPAATDAAARPGPLPAPLTDMAFTRETALSATDRAALLKRLQQVPRPPRAFAQMVSEEFFARASAAELAEVVKTEPLVAAKVLAVVNSAAYGLSRPVVELSEAVSFLGINAVRALCVRYMLDDSFKGGSAAQRAQIDAIWGASVVATELVLQLGQRLNWAETPVLSTQVSLSFVGHLAAAALLGPGHITPVDSEAAHPAMWQRVLREQAELGVPASELSRMLLYSWQLPASLVARVASIDPLLVHAPRADEAPERTAQRVVSYLGARWGERLAWGQLGSPADALASSANEVDTALALRLLPIAPLQRLPDILAAADLKRDIDALRARIHRG